MHSAASGAPRLKLAVLMVGEGVLAVHSSAGAALAEQVVFGESACTDSTQETLSAKKQTVQKK